MAHNLGFKEVNIGQTLIVHNSVIIIAALLTRYLALVMNAEPSGGGSLN